MINLKVLLKVPEKYRAKVHNLNLEVQEMDDVVILTIPQKQVAAFREHVEEVKKAFGEGKQIIVLPKDWEIEIFKLAGVEPPAEEGSEDK